MPSGAPAPCVADGPPRGWKRAPGPLTQRWVWFCPSAGFCLALMRGFETCGGLSQARCLCHGVLPAPQAAGGSWGANRGCVQRDREEALGPGEPSKARHRERAGHRASPQPVPSPCPQRQPVLAACRGANFAQEEAVCWQRGRGTQKTCLVQGQAAQPSSPARVTGSAPDLRPSRAAHSRAGQGQGPIRDPTGRPPPHPRLPCLALGATALVRRRCRFVFAGLCPLPTRAAPYPALAPGGLLLGGGPTGGNTC